MPEREFPFRPLMEPVYEHSMMKRYLEKEVLESVPLDDMEADRGWQLVEGHGELTYTAEIRRTGSRSLQFRVPMRDEEYLRSASKDGSLTTKHGGNVAAVLKFAEPQDWRPYNRISLWVYVHPASMHSYSFNLDFRCEDYTHGPTAPLAVHFIQDLEPGRWNRVVWEIPDMKRDRVTAFTVADLLRGHGAEEGGTVTYNIDRIDLERVEPEKYEGWEVAPGRIAFHHAGYRPTDPKVALATGIGADEFEVVEAVSGRPAARLPVKPLTTPKGRYEELDFTSFSTPGRFFLHCGGVSTGVFEITEDIWCGTIEKLLNFFYGMRCGFPVPGVHGECHADLRGQRDDVLKVINGGWHDAGDLSQGSHRTGLALYAMVRNYEELCRRRTHPKLRERLLEEICWGLDWLLKTRFGDGFRITWYTAHVYTDNVVGTCDDTIAMARHTPFENFLFCAVASLCNCALAQSEPARARAALQAAEEDYRATMDRRGDWSDADRDEAAFGALAAAQLYRATGKESYAIDAATFGRLLIQCQEQRFVDGLPVAGYYYTDTSRTRRVHDNHLSFEGAPGAALEALCDALPEHEDWMEWYGAALLHSQYFLAQGAGVSAPFNLLPNSVWSKSEMDALAADWKEHGRDPAPMIQQFEDGTPLVDGYRLRTFPVWVDHRKHGNTGCQMAATVALSAAARLRNSAALRALADRQLRWVLGMNPFSQSLMYGEGYDWQPHFAYCLRDLVGAMPVGVDCRAGDAPWWTCLNDSDYKEIWVVPAGRYFWNLAYSAHPALVKGGAAVQATFRHLDTGAETKVSGDFEAVLAPGAYEMTCGRLSRRMDLLAGAEYRISLDPRRWIDFDLSASEADGEVTLTAKLRGAGTHELLARAFNGVLDDARRSVKLKQGEEQTVTWRLRVEDAQKPWVALVTPDGDACARREAFGPVPELPAVG
jgi:hypothetical protein